MAKRRSSGHLNVCQPLSSHMIYPFCYLRGFRRWTLCLCGNVTCRLSRSRAMRSLVDASLSESFTGVDRGVMTVMHGQGVEIQVPCENSQHFAARSQHLDRQLVQAQTAIPMSKLQGRLFNDCLAKTTVYDRAAKCSSGGMSERSNIWPSRLDHSFLSTTRKVQRLSVSQLHASKNR